MQPSDLYTLRDAKPRIVSFENPTGEPGKGGMTNRGAKGAACGVVAPGAAQTLMDVKGAGVVRHIWMTLSERDPKTLRSLKLEMYWDGAKKPAVSAPVGDFFGTGLCHRTPFECALFRDPEGKSFNCTIPMPFKRNARMVLTNQSNQPVTLFYSIAYEAVNELPNDAEYFHAFWNRTQRNPLGKDYVILPKVQGRGRFLGASLGFVSDQKLLGAWFGEGEVKMYLDGDGEHPTWVGTGTEDYICTAYGQGAFIQMESGCTLADEAHGRFAFYRYHISDPVYFIRDCRVEIQDMGGDVRDRVRAYLKAGAEITPVTVSSSEGFFMLLDPAQRMDVNAESFPDGWVNFYRRDDYSSMAYFYLDKPSTELPGLPDVAARTANITE